MRIEIPTECPCCNYALETVNSQLFCRNTACPAKTHKLIEHFVKTLGIKGLGPKTLEKLGLTDVTEIFFLDASELEPVVGEKLTAKLLDEIENAASAPLDVVLASFSIPLIGSTASKKIASVVSHIDEINPETCKAAGLGEKATANLCEWLATDFTSMAHFLPFSFKPARVTSTKQQQTVCITGKLKSFKTKAEATQALTERGFTVVESVTKTTTLLVDEENRNSSKRTKAESLGIEIISDLKSFLQEN